MKFVVKKPWGSFEVLEEGPKYIVKKIKVNPGGSLSLQSHKHRSEHWIVTQGEAEVIIDDKLFILKENENIYIPKTSKHRLTNTNHDTLIVIEIWYGDILDESDIERYEDIYKRK